MIPSKIKELEIEKEIKKIFLEKLPVVETGTKLIILGYKLGQKELSLEIEKVIDEVIDNNTEGSEKFISCSPNELKKELKQKLLGGEDDN